MPIVFDVMDHSILGPERRVGIRNGELAVIRAQVTKRFGAIPDWFEERLSAAPTGDLLGTAERILDAKSLEELCNSMEDDAGPAETLKSAE